MDIRNRSIGILISILLFFSLQAQAQKWFDFESGMAMHKVQDIGHSPLLYTGESLFLGLGFNMKSEKFLSKINISFNNTDLRASLLRVAPYQVNSSSRSNIMGSYSLLRTRG